MWLPWEHIYLMAPTKDVQTGEYPDIDTTFLEKFPPLEYFKDRPGRSVLDDVHLHDLSTKGNPSEQELCNRICGHLSTHHRTRKAHVVSAPALASSTGRAQHAYVVDRKAASGCSRASSRAPSRHPRISSRLSTRQTRNRSSQSTASTLLLAAPARAHRSNRRHVCTARVCHKGSDDH